MTRAATNPPVHAVWAKEENRRLELISVAKSNILIGRIEGFIVGVVVQTGILLAISAMGFKFW